MKTTFSTNGLLACLLAVPVLVKVQAQAQTTGNCTTFAWNQQPGYIITDSAPQRVSAAVTCAQKDNSTHLCSIAASGDLQGTVKLDTAVPNAYFAGTGTSFLEQLVLNTVNSSLQGAIWGGRIGAIDIVRTLEPGQSGYLNFTTYLRCFEGTMRNCTGGLQDGTPLRACASVYTAVRSIGPANVLPQLQGVYSLQEVPANMTARYSNPFGGQSRGGTDGNAQRMQNGLLMALLATVASVMVWVV